MPKSSVGRLLHSVQGRLTPQYTGNHVSKEVARTTHTIQTESSYMAVRYRDVAYHCGVALPSMSGFQLPASSGSDIRAAQSQSQLAGNTGAESSGVFTERVAGVSVVVGRT